MAGNRIKGITIEIEGNTTKLSDSLRKVDNDLSETQKSLKDVNKLLKLDPKNTELLRQKTDLLNKAIKDTNEKLKQEKEALRQLEAGPQTEETIRQQEALKREIVDTEKSLESYQKQLDNMPTKLDAVGAAAQKVADKTKALSTAAAGLGAAMLGNAYKAALNADELNTLARNTGLSVEELQKMQYASDLVDVSVDQMTGAMKKLVKQMGSGSDVFDTLGVSIYDANGNLRDSTEVFYESLEALSKVSNETERDTLAMELFGKSAMDLSGIIDDGGQALKEYGQQAEDAGLIMSGDLLNSANEFNDAVDVMKASIQQGLLTAGAQLATTLAPAIQKVTDAVVSLATWFASLDGDTQALILTIVGLVAAISPVATMIASVTTVIGGMSAAITFLSGPIGAAILAITGLISVGVLLYQNWDKLKEAAAQMKANLIQNFNDAKTGITNILNAIKSAVSNAVENLKSAFNFSWSLPQIKLPHFSVSGGEAPWGFGGLGSMPKISVDWYKKAYDNAIMFTRPTVLATQSGLKGFGDGNGSEVVVGTDSLMAMIRSANSGDLATITALLQQIVDNGTTVTLQGDARQMFKVVRKQNQQFKTATGRNAFTY